MWWDEQLGSNGKSARGDLCVLPQTTPRQTLHGPRADNQQPPAQPPKDPWQWWWDQARLSAQAFLAGHIPSEIAIFGPVLDDDERGLLEADVDVSFFYGGTGQYARSDYFVVGRPAVMVGALAVNAAINRRRKIAAQRDAEPTWRDRQTAHLWSTTHRLIWDRGQGVESLAYCEITGFYPDLDTWTAVLATGDGYPPVRLQGPAVPLVALWTATAVLGERWAHDPRLGALLR